MCYNESVKKVRQNNKREFSVIYFFLSHIKIFQYHNYGVGYFNVFYLIFYTCEYNFVGFSNSHMIFALHILQFIYWVIMHFLYIKFFIFMTLNFNMLKLQPLYEVLNIWFSWWFLYPCRDYFRLANQAHLKALELFFSVCLLLCFFYYFRGQYQLLHLWNTFPSCKQHGCF